MHLKQFMLVLLMIHFVLFQYLEQVYPHGTVVVAL
jgi:hypothetical protein